MKTERQRPNVGVDAFKIALQRSHHHPTAADSDSTTSTVHKKKKTSSGAVMSTEYCTSSFAASSALHHQSHCKSKSDDYAKQTLAESLAGLLPRLPQPRIQSSSTPVDCQSFASVDCGYYEVGSMRSSMNYGEMMMNPMDTKFKRHDHLLSPGGVSDSSNDLLEMLSCMSVGTVRSCGTNKGCGKKPSLRNSLISDYGEDCASHGSIPSLAVSLAGLLPKPPICDDSIENDDDTFSNSPYSDRVSFASAFSDFQSYASGHSTGQRSLLSTMTSTANTAEDINEGILNELNTTHYQADDENEVIISPSPLKSHTKALKSILRSNGLTREKQCNERGHHSLNHASPQGVDQYDENNGYKKQDLSLRYREKRNEASSQKKKRQQKQQTLHHHSINTHRLASAPLDGLTREEQDDILSQAKHHQHNPKYELGDTVRSSKDFLREGSITNVFKLRTHDFAFVKRSDGRYTYAILANRSYQSRDAMEKKTTLLPESYPNDSVENEVVDDDMEEVMLFVINQTGSTKLIRKKHWAKCIRCLQLVSTQPVEVSETTDNYMTHSRKNTAHHEQIPKESHPRHQRISRNSRDPPDKHR